MKPSGPDPAIGVPLLLAFLLIFLLMVFALPEHRGGQVCWISDVAWPWEAQAHTIEHCVDYVERR